MIFTQYFHISICRMKDTINYEWKQFDIFKYDRSFQLILVKQDPDNIEWFEIKKKKIFEKLKHIHTDTHNLLMLIVLSKPTIASNKFGMQKLKAIYMQKSINCVTSRQQQQQHRCAFQMLKRLASLNWHRQHVLMRA